MEYIWTRPLMEKSPTTLGAGRRVSIASSCFGSLSLLFSKLILFFIALLLSILSSTYETFFFSVHFVISSPSYATICCCKNSFILSFMTSTYIPLYQTWNQKRKQLDAVASSFSLPFLGYDLLFFFSSLCFLFIHFFFGGRTERRGGPNVYVCELLR